MKYANKLGARYTMVLGDDELASGSARLKNMATGEETTLAIGDDFSDLLARLMANAAYTQE